MTTTASSRATRSFCKAVLAAGLVAGTADLVFATFYYSARHPDPVHIGQMVAGGLFGSKTFQLGMESAALGWICHYFIAFAWAAMFLQAARIWPVLVRLAIPASVAFGAFIYFFMKMVVLPLSAYHATAWPVAVALGPIAIHLFGIGLPMGLAAWRFLPAPADQPYAV